jgi:hypothetical protein
MSAPTEPQAASSSEERIDPQELEEAEKYHSKENFIKSGAHQCGTGLMSHIAVHWRSG